MIEDVVRILKGVMGNREQGEKESLEKGIIEKNNYKRKKEWEGREIKDIMKQGKNGEIDKWRMEKEERIKRESSKDIWEEY